MATQKNKADADGGTGAPAFGAQEIGAQEIGAQEIGAQELGAQISVTSQTGEITGRVVGVELDELIEGQQVSVTQDAGLVSGTLIGVKVGVPDGQATTDKPRRGLAKLLARILRRR